MQTSMKYSGNISLNERVIKEFYRSMRLAAIAAEFRGLPLNSQISAFTANKYDEKGEILQH